MPFDLSMGELLVVLVVALLVFGGKLPTAARKLGATLAEFKRGMNEELRRLDEPPPRQDPPPPDWRAAAGARKDPAEPAPEDPPEPAPSGPAPKNPAEPTPREP